MMPLSVLFGAVVGLSLGLTGGGGAIFAVPLLVFGLGLNARDAIAISLAAVGTTSFVGFLHRWRRSEVEPRTGLLFAIAGTLGAPLGTWLAGRIPEGLLLLSFAVLMVVVAVRLWWQAAPPVLSPIDCPPEEREDRPTCRRDASGRLILNSRCAVLLLVVGLLTGGLSGLFGVGGGFVIVPALVLFSGMSIHRAVGTSLMVVSLVSVSGIVSQLLSGRMIPLELTGLFILGGVAGLWAGQRMGRRLSGPALQKIFSLAILGVATFVIARHFQS